MKNYYSWKKLYSFWESSSQESVIEMMDALDKSGYFSDLKDIDGIHPVMEAPSPIPFLFNREWFDAFDKLLSYGFSVNVVSEEDGGTIFYHLINNRKMWDDDERFRLVNYLMKYDADPRIAFETNSNPIRLAAYYGDFDIYAVFLRKYEDFANEELIKIINYNQDTLDKKAAMDRTKMSMLLMNPIPKDKTEELVEGEVIDNEDGLSLLGESINKSDSDDELEGWLQSEETNVNLDNEEMPEQADEDTEDTSSPISPPVPQKQSRRRNLDE